MCSLWDTLEDEMESCPTNSGGASIKAKIRFNAEEDAKALKEAMKGIGTDEKVLVEILTQRTNEQRQLIREAYEKSTGKTLIHDLKSETSKHMEDVLVALVSTPAEFDCHEVMRAMKGAGSKDSILIEIFASRTNAEIKALNVVYLKETENLLVQDLRKEVSGDFGKAVLLLNEAKRDESSSVNKHMALKDAKALHEASEKKWGTDESKFIEILCGRSLSQLRQTCVEYRTLGNKSLQESIESEMSGELEELLVAIVKCVKSIPTYFAEGLHKSMKGAGTCEETLCRIMVSRSEIDMLDIRKSFKAFKDYSLLSAIDSDLSGDYGKCMKAICGGDD
ncbi:annexin A3a [Platichthys flesus]|uniref:annexin A3a n=1 Tax=Platichthys flesus TaxID=8260 RepID=UPI001A872063|nr:annexin A3a [Platichthys flesus]XP_062237328.1 annexin A3a [Platichthys flesus]